MSNHQFSTLRTADILDALCEAVDAARTDAAGNARWLSAIDTAWGWLLGQQVISFDQRAHALRVQSATHPSICYVANGDCQCTAFQKGAACWHRAAARLVRRALERQAAAQHAALVTLATKVDAYVARQARPRPDAQAEVDELFPPRPAA